MLQLASACVCALTLEVSGAGRNVWVKRKAGTGVRLTELLGGTQVAVPVMRR